MKTNMLISRGVKEKKKKTDNPTVLSSVTVPLMY
jgi:hypothetical protein